MKVFGRYLNYRLRQSFLRTLVFTVLSIMMCLSIVADASTDRVNEEYRTSGIYILAIVLGMFCTLIPILELSGFKNRRNLDTLYFFPIKRSKMALVHYLSGIIQVFCIYTVSFISVWIYLLVKTDCFALGYMPLYYICSLLLGAVMYSIFMFIFGEANTVADGVLFCGLWVFILWLAFSVLRSYFLRPFIADISYSSVWKETVGLPEWGIIYTPINNLTVIFQDLIEVNLYKENMYSYYSSYAYRYITQSYMFGFWVLAGVSAAIGYFVRFAKKGAELAGEISDSPFGYKLLIPLYGYLLLFLFDSVDVLTITVIALMLIGYFIYRRGFKLKKSDIILIVCGIIPLLLASLLKYNYSNYNLI